ncbi:MAG: hypothetical protein O7F12_00455 [Nitrospirae bacterium]|nr:hypothetical protein [Nitrospirota bacterium]
MKKVFYVVVFIVSTCFFGGSHGEASGPKIPAFELRSLDGNMYSDQTIIGQPTLLIF